MSNPFDSVACRFRRDADDDRCAGCPVLAVWGENDEIFGPAGAEAFRRDVPHARVELVDGGHFLLESNLDEVVRVIDEWRSSF
ncbi:alpha/beta fold hydrolase [Rhodococcus sp. OK519]|uniref:alpha/beta fold hydrolase n=1 Tax=Rhodococcus sp. OK519 TaxID=2135729 RepID=UPI003B96DD36